MLFFRWEIVCVRFVLAVLALGAFSCRREQVLEQVLPLQTPPSLRDDRPRHSLNSTSETNSSDDRGSDDCAPPERVRVQSGWELRGFRPGPVFTELLQLEGNKLVGATRSRVCVSDDGGQHWTERLSVRGRLSLVRADEEGGLFVREDRSEGGNSVAAGYWSRDLADHWEPIALPSTSVRGVFVDGRGTVFAATDRQLFQRSLREENSTWSEARGLPGTRAQEVAACGPTLLIARGFAEGDWYYYRSFDRGRTWRAFRLGVLGIEANNAVLRCLGDRGAVEAGRAPIPTHWSFDGGHVWSMAGHDVQFRRSMRVETPTEPPRCEGGPGRTISCVDHGRLRLFSSEGSVAPSFALSAPASCEHVRMLDHHRVAAFGPGCGLLLSSDRGGLWRRVFQSWTPTNASAYAAGRGGFLDERIAWRLDGGVWWTRDGGVSWKPMTSILGRSLERGVFVNEQRGVFSTRDGWVVSTRDGGRTWTWVLRGEVERIVRSGRLIAVTTATSARISRDGGNTWQAGVQSVVNSWEPSVEVLGARREVLFERGLRVFQREGQVHLEAAGTTSLLLSGLPAGCSLLAAVRSPSGVRGVLLEGGAVLAKN